ncbi:hypothetical protein ACOCJ7_08095 [Knoellia sp. CPCC 206453]|uniref:hypothetical protein n=1 Tax=Knoellia pratensis TaxID=3404796 RepID=UPI003622D291
MRLTQTWESRLPTIVAYAVFAPLVVSGTLAIWRDSIPHATVVLALVVGVAVTELALWGQRWHADAAENAARLEVLVATARSVADHQESELIVREVEEQLTALLDLDRATWIPSTPAASAAVLRRDGVIVGAGVAQDGGHQGFPTDTAVSLPGQPDGPNSRPRRPGGVGSRLSALRGLAPDGLPPCRPARRRVVT